MTEYPIRHRARRGNPVALWFHRFFNAHIWSFYYHTVHDGQGWPPKKILMARCLNCNATRRVP